MSNKFKNDIDILVGQAVFKLRIKIVKILSWSKPKNQLAFLRFNDIFEFLSTIYYIGL